MKLGNSNGNNTGKKYFVRGRDDQDLDIVYAEQAENFAAWFAKNMMAARSQLMSKGNYNDDAFSETYLRIYEIILYTGRVINDYASYFHRAYFTNTIQYATKENRYCELYPNYDTVDEDDVEYFEEIEYNNRSLENDIMAYIYGKYAIQEFEIFKMYVNLKPAVNYHFLAKMTDSKYHTIQRLISKIIADVRGNANFAMQRRRVAGA